MISPAVNKPTKETLVIGEEDPDEEAAVKEVSSSFVNN
jgi:hypothetical protein